MVKKDRSPVKSLGNLDRRAQEIDIGTKFYEYARKSKRKLCLPMLFRLKKKSQSRNFFAQAARNFFYLRFPLSCD